MIQHGLDTLTPPVPNASNTPVAHRGKRGRQMRAAFVFVAYPAAFSVAVIVIWQIVVSVFDVQPLVVPSPVDVAQAAKDHWHDLLSQTWPTLIEILVGFAISVVSGVLTAILITAVPVVDKMLRPLLVASLVVPKIAVAPLFVVWFGFGYAPKILLTALIAFFPIVVDTALGLKSLPREMELLMRSMGAGRLRSFFKIVFPHALPNIFAGLKVGIALAVVGATVAEFVQSSEGLGFLLLQADQNLNTPLFFAGILVLTIVGIALYVVIEGIEYFALRSRRGM